MELPILKNDFEDGPFLVHHASRYGARCISELVHSYCKAQRYLRRYFAVDVFVDRYTFRLIQRIWVVQNRETRPNKQGGIA